MRNRTLVVVPGPGARTIQAEDNMTVAEFVCRENLHGRDIILDGAGIAPSAWSESVLGEALEIFATGSVKGN